MGSLGYLRGDSETRLVDENTSVGYFLSENKEQIRKNIQKWKNDAKIKALLEDRNCLIKSMHFSGRYSLRDLALMFCLGKSYISEIINNSAKKMAMLEKALTK